MGRRTKVLLGVGAGVALAQLVTLVALDEQNPPAEGPLEAPADVAPLLRRACYDCHSNETRWPWYSRIVPGAWLIARDVVDGRRHLNFSTWKALSDAQRARKLGQCVDELEDGEMPPWFYLPLHRDAALSDAEKQAVLRWARAGAESEPKD